MFDKERVLRLFFLFFHRIQHHWAIKKPALPSKSRRYRKKAVDMGFGKGVHWRTPSIFTYQRNDSRTKLSSQGDAKVCPVDSLTLSHILAGAAAARHVCPQHCPGGGAGPGDADALVLHGTLNEQVAAQESLVTATARRYTLSQARYERGIDSSLNVLDAQRRLAGRELICQDNPWIRLHLRRSSVPGRCVSDWKSLRNRGEMNSLSEKNGAAGKSGRRLPTIRERRGDPDN